MNDAAKRPTTVHIVNRMAPGGIETLVLDLMRTALPGRRVVVFSMEGERAELLRQWPVLAQFKDDVFGFAGRPGRRFGMVPKLRRALLQLQPDQVFLHHIGPLLYGGLAARLAGSKAALVHVEHDVWHYDQHPRHGSIFKWCERLLRPQHFAVSHPIKARLLELRASAGVTVVAPGIDTKHFQPGDRCNARQALGLPVSTPVIGTAGRLAAVKGHRFLIDALRLLRAREPASDVRLIIAGDGEQRGALEAAVTAHGLDGAVHFLGRHDDMAKVYPALDVFCLPSLNEGLPRAVIEAQACGVPVVASNVGALGDAICPATGALTAPGDAEGLARALQDVLATPADSARLRDFVERTYDFSMTRRHYEQVTQRCSSGAVRDETVNA